MNGFSISAPEAGADNLFDLLQCALESIRKIAGSIELMLPLSVSILTADYRCIATAILDRDSRRWQMQTTTTSDFAEADSMRLPWRLCVSDANAEVMEIEIVLDSAPLQIN